MIKKVIIGFSVLRLNFEMTRCLCFISFTQTGKQKLFSLPSIKNEILYIHASYLTSKVQDFGHRILQKKLNQLRIHGKTYEPKFVFYCNTDLFDSNLVFSEMSLPPKSPMTFSVSMRTDVFNQYASERGFLIC